MEILRSRRGSGCRPDPFAHAPRRCLAAGLALALGVLTEPAAAAVTQVTEVLPPPGSLLIPPLELSADGSTIVGGFGPAFGAPTHAFRWTAATGAVDLQAGAEGSSFATGVSADGDIVAGRFASAANGSQAFRWTPGSVVLDNTPQRYGNSAAAALSADGRIVAGTVPYSASDGNTRIFLWSYPDSLAYVGEEIPGVGVSYAPDALSADGSALIGTIGWPLGVRFFRWSLSEGYDTYAECTPGCSASPRHLSGDGRVAVVGFLHTAGGGAPVSSYNLVYRWTRSDGLQLITRFPADQPGANADVDRIEALSYDGSVMVGEGYRNGAQQAIRWTAAGGAQSVGDWFASHGGSPPALPNSSALGVSADGNTVLVYSSSYDASGAPVYRYYLLGVKDDP